ARQQIPSAPISCARQMFPKLHPPGSVQQQHARTRPYHPEDSHVIPGLIRRFHEAKLAGADEVPIWGTGKPRREFLFSDDLAEACLHLLELEDPPSLINIGAGDDVTILDLAALVAETVGFEGKIVNDQTKPDGTPRKLMDSSLIHSLGWKATTTLEDGLGRAYEDFLANQS
ncbi:MAG: NAD-dependent epimerase/dehydratase family protein, partial [Verrucomicrobiota bacterium]